MESFATRLHHRVQTLNTRVCLGLDPRPALHRDTDPQNHDNDPAKVARAVVVYFRQILDATADLVACYKPQSAFFEALGIPGLIALAQLQADIRDRGVPLLTDAKRGDLDSTASAYASTYLADGVFASDALTVNPYMGVDSLLPFTDRALEAGRGVFQACQERKVRCFGSNKNQNDLAPDVIVASAVLDVPGAITKMLLVVTGPTARVLWMIPAGIHTLCAGGTTQAPCSVVTSITPVDP